MRRSTLAVAMGLAAALLVGPTPGLSAADDPHTPGAPGVGDPYYPLYGNGGYDVQHYDLAIRYDPRTDHLRGKATIDAVATQGLSSFNLDFVGLTVRCITVDGAPGTWSRTEHELTVTPATAIDEGSRFAVVVRYGGIPITAYDPFFRNIQVGFMHTPDGAIVLGEPEVAAFWYPVNDHPIDRATYTFHVTVPDAYQVVANGLPSGMHAHNGWTTHTWTARDPMVSYLATVDIGTWVMADYTRDGLRVIDAVAPSAVKVASSSLERQPEIVTFLEDQYGPYPFESVGAIVDDYGRLWFAMETQTRPIYPRFVFPAHSGDVFVVHELAHMWFGDLVAVNQWKDIWLNEGFASYAEWLWAEHEGQATPQQILEETYASIPAGNPFWDVEIGDPGPADMFSDAVYARGAMTVQALRHVVGDEAFRQIIAQWLDANAWANGSTEEFMELAELVSGQDLEAFFETWLFTGEKPPESSVIPTMEGALRTDRTSVPPGAAQWARTWLELVEMRARG